MLAVIDGTVLGIVGFASGAALLNIGWIVPIGYLAGITAGSLMESRGQSWAVRLRLPAVLATMHFS